MSNYIGETLYFSRIVVFLICCVLLQAVLVSAKVPCAVCSYDQMLKDFAPLSTLVAEVSESSLILDKGNVHGVKVGDLFEVYGRGSPVLDPDVGEIIGYIKRPLATIRVIQSEDSKCICEVVKAQGPLSVGQPAMRYSDMAAAFVDRSELSSGAEEFRHDLVHALPGLVWLDPSDVPSDVLDAESMKALGIVLLFALEQDSLKVYGPELDLLHEYPVVRARGPKRQKYNADIFEGIDYIGDQHETEKRKLNTHPESFDLDNARIVGRLPESAIQIDILDLNGDQELEIVYLLPSGLYVSRYESPGELAYYGLTGPGRLVSFSAANTDGWIVLNVLLDGAGLRSILLIYQDFKLSLVQDEINLWLAFVDMDGDGVKESLLGQGFDVDVMFGAKVYLMEPHYEGLNYRHRIVSPKNFSVIRSSWSDLNGNGVPEVCIIDYSGKLCIYEMEQMLWSSSSPVSPQLPEGGFPKCFITTDLNVNGLPELLFPGVPGEKSTLVGDWLMLVGWEDGSYVLKSMMQPVEASICGLVVIQDQLIIGIARPPQQPEEKGDSFLYSFGQFGAINHISD